MSATAPVIAIDGPSGSGKGTVASRVAETLDWHLLDSGALYRLVGYAALERGVALDEHAALAAIAADLDVTFRVTADGIPGVILEGRAVDREIRTEEVARAASQVAALQAVRSALLDRQRAFRRPPGLVADGRDMGTVVFPDARCKVFLTASAEARADRRHKQLKGKGISVNLRALLGEIRARDRRDTERRLAPLMPADDAVVIDTTALAIDEVVAKVMALAAERVPLQ